MKKDTIYIDIEDDITAIIDKVKGSDSGIIALVPPKRTEVLQSVVNLKLLQRSAKESKKSLVLVTAHPSLVSLAGGIGIHTAKDLHSKPQVPEAPDLEETEAVVGDVPTIVDETLTLDAADSSKPEMADDKVPSDDKKPKKASSSAAATTKKPKKKSKKKSDKAAKVKIPNFDRFRNKLLLASGALVLLVIGWWFAFISLPTATISIQAQTSRIETKQPVTISPALTKSDIAKFKVAAQSQEVVKKVEEKVIATGERNVGNKASGVITVQNCDSSDAFTISAGTGFSANDLTFISAAEVVVPGASFSGGSCSGAGVADVTVVAQESGDQYNLTTGTSYSIASQGALVSGVGGQMTGGTSEIVKVITQADVNKAAAKISELPQAEIAPELTSQFAASQIVIAGSYKVSASADEVLPAVGEEAETGVVKRSYTYSQLAIEKADLEAVLAANQNEQFDESQQTIYETGIDDVVFKVNSRTEAGVLNVNVLTSAFIGPTINTAQLAESVSGKRFSEVVEIAKQVPGVTDVVVEFEPFWVFSAPRNAEKIDIQLDVAEHTLQ